MIFYDIPVQMCKPRCIFLLTVFLVFVAFPIFGEDESAKQQRTKINEVLQTYRETNRPINLGLLVEVIKTSNTYGSEAFKNDKKQKSYTFYRTSVEDLLELADSGLEATEDARKALTYLEQALRRSGSMESASDRAWAMRFGFERVLKERKLLATEARALLEMGKKYYQKGLFWASQDVFKKQVGLLDELAGSSNTDLPRNLRIGPFFYGHALFGAGKFREAADALKRAHDFLPEWQQYASRVKRRENFPSASEYDRLLNRLKKQVKNNPRPELQFLLGYEYFMTEKKKKARKQFKQLDPDTPYGNISEPYLSSLKEDLDDSGGDGSGGRTF